MTTTEPWPDGPQPSPVLKFIKDLWDSIGFHYEAQPEKALWTIYHALQEIQNREEKDAS